MTEGGERRVGLLKNDTVLEMLFIAKNSEPAEETQFRSCHIIFTGRGFVLPSLHTGVKSEQRRKSASRRWVPAVNTLREEISPPTHTTLHHFQNGSIDELRQSILLKAQ